MILNKKDLEDDEETKKWIKFFEAKTVDTFIANRSRQSRLPLIKRG